MVVLDLLVLSNNNKGMDFFLEEALYGLQNCYNLGIEFNKKDLEKLYNLLKKKEITKEHLILFGTYKDIEKNWRLFVDYLFTTKENRPKMIIRDALKYKLKAKNVKIRKDKIL